MRRRLAISAQRAESFGGAEGSCEFAQVQREGAGWRTRARCSAHGKSWTANVQLRVTGSTLSLVERARTGHLLPVSPEGKRHGIAGSTVAGSFRCRPPNRPCQAVEALWMTFPAACGVSAVDEQHHPPESQRHGPALPLSVPRQAALGADRLLQAELVFLRQSIVLEQDAQDSSLPLTIPGVHRR